MLIFNYEKDYKFEALILKFETFKLITVVTGEGCRVCLKQTFCVF